MTRLLWMPRAIGFGAVVCLDLEGDDQAADVDHARLARHGEPLRRRGQMLDLDRGAHTSLVVLEAACQSVTRGVFEMRDQPGGRQDRGHSTIDEADPVLRAHRDHLLSTQPDSRNLPHGNPFLSS